MTAGICDKGSGTGVEYFAESTIMYSNGSPWKYFAEWTITRMAHRAVGMPDSFFCCWGVCRLEGRRQRAHDDSHLSNRPGRRNEWSTGALGELLLLCVGSKFVLTYVTGLILFICMRWHASMHMYVLIFVCGTQQPRGLSHMYLWHTWIPLYIIT